MIYLLFFSSCLSNPWGLSVFDIVGTGLPADGSGFWVSGDWGFVLGW